MKIRFFVDKVVSIPDEDSLKQGHVVEVKVPEGTKMKVVVQRAWEGMFRSILRTRFRPIDEPNPFHFLIRTDSFYKELKATQFFFGETASDIALSLSPDNAMLHEVLQQMRNGHSPHRIGITNDIFLPIFLKHAWGAKDPACVLLDKKGVRFFKKTEIADGSEECIFNQTIRVHVWPKNAPTYKLQIKTLIGIDKTLLVNANAWDTMHDVTRRMYDMEGISWSQYAGNFYQGRQLSKGPNGPSVFELFGNANLSPIIHHVMRLRGGSGRLSRQEAQFHLIPVLEEIMLKKEVLRRCALMMTLGRIHAHGEALLRNRSAQTQHEDSPDLIATKGCRPLIETVRRMVNILHVVPRVLSYIGVSGSTPTNSRLLRHNTKVNVDVRLDFIDHDGMLTEHKGKSSMTLKIDALHKSRDVKRAFADAFS